MEIIGIERWIDGCSIIEYKRIGKKMMSGSRDEMEGEKRGLGRERKRSRREQARKAEKESEREKRNVSWWSLRSHSGKGGWLKLGKGEPAATALITSRLAGRAGR